MAKFREIIGFVPFFFCLVLLLVTIAAVELLYAFREWRRPQWGVAARAAKACLDIGML